MTEYLIPEKDTEKLRIKLDDAYKESLEIGVKDFRRGDGEKDVRRYVNKALSSYRQRLMEIMRLQMMENEAGKGK